MTMDLHKYERFAAEEEAQMRRRRLMIDKQFEGCKPSLREALFDGFEEVARPWRYKLVRAGNRAEEVFLVFRGSLVVSELVEPEKAEEGLMFLGRRKEWREVRIVGPEGMIGVYECHTGEPYGYEVSVNEKDTLVYRISKDYLMILAANDERLDSILRRRGVEFLKRFLEVRLGPRREGVMALEEAEDKVEANGSLEKVKEKMRLGAGTQQKYVRGRALERSDLGAAENGAGKGTRGVSKKSRSSMLFERNYFNLGRSFLYSQDLRKEHNGKFVGQEENKDFQEVTRATFRSSRAGKRTTEPKGANRSLNLSKSKKEIEPDATDVFSNYSKDLMVRSLRYSLEEPPKKFQRDSTRNELQTIIKKRFGISSLGDILPPADRKQDKTDSALGGRFTKTNYHLAENARPPFKLMNDGKPQFVWDPRQKVFKKLRGTSRDDMAKSFLNVLQSEISYGGMSVGKLADRKPEDTRKDTKVPSSK